MNDASRERGGRGPAKVVYFVASHVNPEQVVRLVRALRTGGPDSRVLIHHDYRVSHLDPASVQRFGNVELLYPPSPTRWGTFSTCRMVLRAMAWARRRYDFDFFTYLSGQDFPIKPPLEIERSLHESDYDGYLDAVPVHRAQWFLGIERYLYRYYNLPALPGFGRLRQFLRGRERAATSGAGTPGAATRGAGCPRRPHTPMPRVHVPRDGFGQRKVGLRPPWDDPFSADFQCYVGSAWWTLSRQAVAHVLEFERGHRGLARHYELVLFAPLESFFLTILMNEPRLKLCARDNKRFIRWTDPGSGHPDVLRAADFDQIIGSGGHFARKIDAGAEPGLLHLLERHIGAPPP
jgi:Core-2/I-Branching enzyme